MKFELSQYVQRGHHFAIVDEVDSILIDEARTPLIISGPAEASTDLYYEVDRIIPKLKAGAKTRGDAKAEEREALEATGDYIVDEKHKTVTLTESGMAAAEKHLSHRLNGGHLYDMENAHIKHHVEQALRAHVDLPARRRLHDQGRPGRHRRRVHRPPDARTPLERRPSPGGRGEGEGEDRAREPDARDHHLSELLPQVQEAVRHDRHRRHRSGRVRQDLQTGRHRRSAQQNASRRIEEPDSIYRTEAEKSDAIVNDILAKQEEGRPVLVGTVSIEKSEKLSSKLKRRGIKHVVLNAKYHAQEAEFVAQAGRKSTVTIATNMAGRGTDILLGGNPEFMARQQLLGEEKAERLPRGEERFTDDEQFVYFYHLDAFYRTAREDWDRVFNHFRDQTEADHKEVVDVGGLHIIGTERHEARRIDNQLRGRAGRQGDPGSSRFYMSLEDDLMRIFGSDRIAGLMQRLGMEDGVPIEHGMVTKAIERAQKQVEAQNFGTRKHLLEYDDVMNKQRENIYALRRELLEGKVRIQDEDEDEGIKEIDTRAYLMTLAEDILDDAIEAYAGKDTDPEEWDLDALKMDMSRVFGLDAGDYARLDFKDKSAEEIRERALGRASRRSTRRRNRRSDRRF